MKSKSAVVIASAAAVLAVVILLRIFVFKHSAAVLTPKIVTPIASNSKDASKSKSEMLSDSASLTSFVPLLATETLISTTVFDFDGDNFDDQVAAVHKAGSQNIFLIVGLYNPSTNSYIRAAEISTEVSKTRTFSYAGIDMTGTHRTALVYQGEKTNGESVLRMYHCQHQKEKIEILTIGNFSSDGTIFIQQTERSESYELSQTRGESFAVWVYSSDKRSGKTSENAVVNQIQTEYRWSETEQKYIQSKQLNITGSTLAAKELSRIQNGNLETFANFLTGLWYKTTSDGMNPRYIHFNYDTKEVIFLSEDTEGVYSWEDSNLRRSGIYLTAVNTIIPSMKRRFDISLTGINEVRILVHDNVGMIIKENNQWDGIYHKLSFQTTFGEAKSVSNAEQIVKKLRENSAWSDGNGNNFVFTGNTFRISGNAEENGIFAMDDVGQFTVIQFRSTVSPSMLSGAYSIRFLPKQEANAASDTDSVVFSPVRLAPNTCYPADGYAFTLTKN